MQLRHCCNHPFLIKGVVQAEGLEHADDDTWCERLVHSSGKLVLLDKLLPSLQRQGHRVLLFSQFKMLLDLLEDYVRLRGYKYERLDGSVTGEARQAAIDRYTEDAAKFVFLIGTRAGGVGINLVAADTVVIYDPDWNPQNDIQAQARCHRIGQTKTVNVYRLVTRGTYEEQMYQRANFKLGLERAVIGKGGYEGGGRRGAPPPPRPSPSRARRAPSSRRPRSRSCSKTARRRSSHRSTTRRSSASPPRASSRSSNDP